MVLFVYSNLQVTTIRRNEMISILDFLYVYLHRLIRWPNFKNFNQIPYKLRIGSTERGSYR